ncbi:hypothetical protein [Streptomyces rimosus]|uniref:hypothetical protein n=1 Tax=Streptomyces rimosus TaxID=1927 RepID=UPI000A6BAC68|nr:hypothetical protein [Streptomyces rimosus]
MRGPEAIRRGLCWLACKPSSPRPLVWAGVARSWGQTVSLYSCEPCLRLCIQRALAGVSDELCWLWCGRRDVPTDPVGVFEVAVRTWRTVPGRPPVLVSCWEYRATLYGCAMCTTPFQRFVRKGPVVEQPPDALGPHRPLISLSALAADAA